MNPQPPMALEQQKVDILQLLFFLIGAPHIYGALRFAGRQRQQRPPVLQYVAVGMLAMAIASAAEIWFL